MSKAKKLFSIPSAIKLAEEKFERALRLPELIGYRSADVVKAYKSVIALCNSLSIVFLQYDLFKQAFFMLQKAVRVDSELDKFGTEKEKLWQGRIITYNSLALLFHKLGRHKDSLKLLLQAEGFLVNLTKASITPNIDIELSVSMLLFITLWKVKKHFDARLYLERAAKLINYVITSRRISNISKLGGMNLYGIIVMGLAGLKLIIENDSKSALRMCKDAAKQLEGSNVLSRPLILKMIKFISENKSFTIPDISHVEFKPGTFKMFSNISSGELPSLKINNGVDWLVTDKYEKVLFITTFLPLMSPLTPWVDTLELESAKSKKIYSPSIDSSVEMVQEKKVRDRLRTESTPRPRINRHKETGEKKRQRSQYEYDRSTTSGLNNRHIMFEFSSASERNSSVPIDLVPIAPKKALPALRKTLVNFKNLTKAFK